MTPRKPNTSKTTKTLARTGRVTAPSRVERTQAPKTEVAPDVVSLLRADHTKLRRLLAELVSAERPSDRLHRLDLVKQELEAHTKAEEEVFYAAFHAAAQTTKDEVRFHEAMAEHHAAERMLQEVASAADATEQFPGRAKVLEEMIEHHLEEEETDIFPRARKLIKAPELHKLGKQLGMRKRELLNGDSASSPLQRLADFVTSPFSRPSKPSQATHV
mgnify:CR=1 FL=1